MIEALYNLFSETLDAIWAGVLYGISISIGLVVVFQVVKLLLQFHKAAQLLEGVQ